MKCDVHWCNALSTQNSRWCAVHQDEYEQQGPDLQRAEGPYPLDISFALLKRNQLYIEGTRESYMPGKDEHVPAPPRVVPAITGGISGAYDKAKEFGARIDDAAMGAVPRSQVTPGESGSMSGGTLDTTGQRTPTQLLGEAGAQGVAALRDPVSAVIGQKGRVVGAEAGQKGAGTGLVGIGQRAHEKVKHKLVGEGGLIKPKWGAHRAKDDKTGQYYNFSSGAPRFIQAQQNAIRDAQRASFVGPHMPSGGLP